MNDQIDNGEHIDNNGSNNSVATTNVPSTYSNNNESFAVVWFQPVVWYQPVVNFDNYEQAKQNYYNALQQQQQQQQQHTSLINTNTYMKKDIINIQDRSGYTALHHVCFSKEEILSSNGGINFIQNFLLSNNNIDISIRANDDDTPLDISIESGHCEVVKLLLEFAEKENVDILLPSANDGYTALHVATIFSRYETVKLLLEFEEKKINDYNNKNNKNDDIAFRTTTTIISGDNHHHYIEEDVNKEAIINMIHVRNKHGQTPLYIAVKDHNIEIIKLLLSCYAKYQKIIPYNNKYYYLNMPDNYGISPIQLIHQHKKELEEKMNINDTTNLLRHNYNTEKLNTFNKIIELLQEEERVQHLIQIYQFIWKYHHDCME